MSESDINGSVGKIIPEDKYESLNISDMCAALNVIVASNYGVNTLITLEDAGLSFIGDKFEVNMTSICEGSVNDMFAAMLTVINNLEQPTHEQRQNSILVVRIGKIRMDSRVGSYRVRTSIGCKLLEVNPV